MINIKNIPEDEIDIYNAAREYLGYLIRQNNYDFKRSLDETLIKFENDNIKDREMLKKYLREEISGYREQGKSISLLNSDVKNSKWWTEFSKKNDIQYWTRYYKYLEKEKGWRKFTINKSIDKVTDIIMNSIANPLDESICERKGMVIGYVQSGKTSNYIGLINKAIDAGYKIIIVLSGMHNNLRSQTQSRIDEEVLGYETVLNTKSKNNQKNVIGVGKIFQTDKFVQSFTSRDDNGDFDRKKRNLKFNLDNPNIIVTKKQSSVLRNLIANLKAHPITDNIDGNKVISSKYPLLLIDDEADQASINTNYIYDSNDNIVEGDEDPSTINGLIRELFNIFECRSYVGYTATPYANIFIPDDAKSEKFGGDLFPKDFIIALPKPNKYIGAKEFFGDENNDEMPLVRNITNDNFIKDNKKIKVVMTSELKEAIMSFIMTIAIRNCRGYRFKPNSMLIHLNRTKDVQKNIYSIVKTYYEDLQEMILDGDSETIETLEKLWFNDYKNTTLKMQNDFSKYMIDCEELEFSDVYDEIKEIIENDSIKIFMINGDSKDSLMYKEHENEIYNVIAIGGDKLSRGLTLEGLSISYFCRESKMYDTLMQMGRWFGFREGYADLCRLYVTENLLNWFKKISFATEDLRDQIEYMNDRGFTPEEFGLKIATSPEIKISNDKKIKSGQLQYLNFSNNLTQTRDFDIDEDTYNHNFKVTEEFLISLGDDDKDFVTKKLHRNLKNGHLFWVNINGKIIAEYLKKYRTSKYANKVVSLNMAKYIENQLKYGGLTNWTVCLINRGKEKTLEIANRKIGKGIVRDGNGCIYHSDKNVCSLASIKSNYDEYLDFTEEQMKQADIMRNNKKNLSEKNISRYIRSELRERENGLLIIYPINCDEGKTSQLKIKGCNHKTPIGLLIVFPDNKKIGETISYELNPVFKKGERNELFD